jgi:hypothetical protein
MVAFGCSSGQITLADLRVRFKTEQVISAHSGGLLAMDVSGGLMATAGLGTRQGHLVPDTIVKVNRRLGVVDHQKAHLRSSKAKYEVVYSEGSGSCTPIFFRKSSVIA